MMRLGGRLALGTVLVLLATVVVLVWASEISLRRNLERDFTTALEREARLVREALPRDSTGWRAAVANLASHSGLRVTIIDRSGRVVVESELAAGQERAMENHAGRPEVRAALAGEVGSDARRSASLGTRLLYVAIPGGPGVVRLAAPLDQVDATVRRAQRSVLAAAGLALAVGLVLALVAGRSIARPLTTLAAAARAIASGNLPRFPRSRVPEIDTLVGALREMHVQLADRFDQLRREQAASAALLEAMVEGVLAADVRGRIIMANNAARRMLGYGADDPLPALPALFRVREAREVVDEALAGRGVSARELVVDEAVFSASARPLPHGGVILVLTDLSDIRRLEKVRRDFVANVSHELKTPLTSISGYAETLLGDRPEPETAERFLRVILGNARRMQRLVDSLLDLSRIESGRWQPHPERVDIAAMAREVWDGLREPGQDQRVHFTCTTGAGAGHVRADPDALRQVLTNLVDNALRYTAAGGRIQCASALDGGEIRLTVTDNGAGIRGDHLPRIFERFYRADAARSRDEGGTGLGLAIVKHLVEAHGGRVAAESEVGVGTTISCWFPCPGEDATGSGPPA